jgi:hypothetical protein
LETLSKTRHEPTSAGEGGDKLPLPSHDPNTEYQPQPPTLNKGIPFLQKQQTREASHQIEATQTTEVLSMASPSKFSGHNKRHEEITPMAASKVEH